MSESKTLCARDSGWCDGVLCRQHGINCPNADPVHRALYLEGYWDNKPFGRVGPVKMERQGRQVRVDGSLEVPAGSGVLTAAVVDDEGRKLIHFPAITAAPGDLITVPPVTFS